jgi:hypothetical protein
MNERDRKLDALLARGGMSGGERERIVDEILPKRRLWSVARIAWMSPILAGAAALVLWWMPVRRSGFTARGTAQKVGLSVGCLDGGGTRCVGKSVVVFRVDGADRTAHFFAYAKKDGQTLWYFPTESGSSPEVRAQSGPQVLRQAASLGATGRYELHLILSEQAMSRAEILQAPSGHFLAEDVAEVEVVP